MKIEIIRFDNFYKAPKRAHYNDAGADLYLPIKVYIPAHSTRAVPLGLGLKIPDGFMGMIYSRSSLSRRQIVCEMPPIDSGYRGEIHAVVSNLSEEGISLEAGTRVGQLVIQPVILAEFVDELGDKRDCGAFGSTGE